MLGIEKKTSLLSYRDEYFVCIKLTFDVYIFISKYNKVRMIYFAQMMHVQVIFFKLRKKLEWWTRYSFVEYDSVDSYRLEICSLYLSHTKHLTAINLWSTRL